MKKFMNNVRKYQSYMIFSAKATLKGEVAGSKLNWLWWILNPFLFMLVYTFVSLVVFGKGEPFFPVFVFVGLNLWDFFSRTVQSSVTLVHKYKGMISKVYLPKYVIIMSNMLVNGFKMCVAFSLVLLMIPIYRVPITYRFIELIPVVIVLLLFTFGVSCIFLNAGVFTKDLGNVVTVALRLMFYMSGIFYNIAKRVPKPYNTIMLKVNPVACLIQSARNCLLYQEHIYWKEMLLWLVISILLCVWGVRTISKHENSYVKVI